MNRTTNTKVVDKLLKKLRLGKAETWSSQCNYSKLNYLAKKHSMGWKKHFECFCFDGVYYIVRIK